MSRMLDLIRANALSSHQMMSASKGALRLPAAEMVEILVCMAEHNKIFGANARFTLAAWDEASARAIVADSSTPREVLDYWLDPRNLRSALFPLLLENESVPLTKIAELATTLKSEWIEAMIVSPRVRKSRQIQNDLSSNKDLSGVQAARVRELITGKPAEIPAPAPPVVEEPVVVSETHSPESTVPPEPHAPVAPVSACASDPDAALVAFYVEHAAEIAAEGEKPFQPIGGIHDGFHDKADVQTKVAAAAASASQAPALTPSAAPAPKPALPKRLVNPEDEKRGSVLQKISKLDIKGRIHLAMKGTKEERAILVRDGTKIVALAVLDSPKISDGEVEKFASQRNVLEALLRAIPLKRRFIKNYAVVRNLVFNPRTPLDIGLGLMKNLLIQDLRNLSGNKEVSETVRKLALRMFKQKSEAATKK
ncbi:MAG: hypothetical protein DMG98_02560 [Acidobacteria bacterium]|nr:MAG: hypothetical protein DMG98_02560 [Acidobacteriota bacterium]